jgi:hypothetical protein
MLSVYFNSKRSVDVLVINISTSHQVLLRDFVVRQLLSDSSLVASMESPFSSGSLKSMKYRSEASNDHRICVHVVRLFSSSASSLSEKTAPRSKVPFIVLGILILALAISTVVLALIVVNKSKKTDTPGT